MEVGDESCDDAHFVGRGNHQGGAGLKSGEPMLVEIIDDVL